MGVIEGRCLCGEVRFRMATLVGPFELCHCPRCRRGSGSAFLPMVGVRTRDLEWLAGRELVRTYEAPVRERPPAYRRHFCGRCGAPVPDPAPAGEWLEIPAGALEGELGLQPDRHILVEHRLAWFDPADGLPRLDRPALDALRKRGGGDPT